MYYGAFRVIEPWLAFSICVCDHRICVHIFQTPAEVKFWINVCMQSHHLPGHAQSLVFLRTILLQLSNRVCMTNATLQTVMWQELINAIMISEEGGIPVKTHSMFACHDPIMGITVYIYRGWFRRGRLKIIINVWKLEVCSCCQQKLYSVYVRVHTAVAKDDHHMLCR